MLLLWIMPNFSFTCVTIGNRGCRLCFAHVSSRRSRPRPLLLASSETHKRFGSSRVKVTSVEDAVHLVPNGATVTVAGFVGQGCAEEICAALAKRFEQTGEPNGLTLVFGGGPGDWDKRGLNHFAKKGMLKRAIGSHLRTGAMLGQAALDNMFEAYYFPMGTVSRMIRNSAAGLPGFITSVGLGRSWTRRSAAAR